MKQKFSGTSSAGFRKQVWWGFHSWSLVDEDTYIQLDIDLIMGAIMELSLELIEMSLLIMEVVSDVRDIREGCPYCGTALK
ncbi:unnamed protein product [Dovyalis caffra]|uniref:Uncharacterized protein n=1 Tax=Dovyalis caffra TaxID=77055 RepID=A0AAV1RDT8_9ROSI|nr:unnamed protein product [Dovyalis caffra]